MEQIALYAIFMRDIYDRKKKPGPFVHARYTPSSRRLPRYDSGGELSALAGLRKVS